MLCDDCKEYTDAVSRTAGGHCFLGNGDETLIPFIIFHAHHKVRVIDEHDSFFDASEENEDGDFSIPEWKEWTAENRKLMYNRYEGS